MPIATGDVGRDEGQRGGRGWNGMGWVEEEKFSF
jgi:hypothetical protein